MISGTQHRNRRGSTLFRQKSSGCLLCVSNSTTEMQSGTTIQTTDATEVCHACLDFTKGSLTRNVGICRDSACAARLSRAALSLAETTTVFSPPAWQNPKTPDGHLQLPRQRAWPEQQAVAMDLGREIKGREGINTLADGVNVIGGELGSP
jgi:hypothetical protein